MEISKEKLGCVGFMVVLAGGKLQHLTVQSGRNLVYNFL
jgi:hypothetical protein